MPNINFLPLLIAFVMLFNLSVPAFAAPKIATKEQKNQITSALTEAYNQSPSNPKKESYNAKYYENNYESSLARLSQISETYATLHDMAMKAANIEVTANSELDHIREGIEAIEKEDSDYNRAWKSYEKEIEKLGGDENIKKKYDLYQEWLDLKPQIDARKAELEQVINTGNKAAVQKAKKELRDYQKNFYSHQNDFDNFQKDLDEITKTETYLSEETTKLKNLTELYNGINIQVREAKQDLLNLLPEETGLTSDSDWDQIFNAVQKEIDSLFPQLTNAITNFEKAEQEQEAAYEADLQKRLKTSFAQAEKKSCDVYQDEADLYATPGIAINGKVKGHNVAVEGSCGWGQNCNVAQSVIFSLQKDAYKQCINPSWNEEGLKRYNAGITMEELANLKYGEYLLKYGFEEKINISTEEAKEMGQKLARKNLALAILDSRLDSEKDFQFSQKALELYYTALGDYNQTSTLNKFLKDDWVKKGYGTIEHYKEPVEWDEETGDILVEKEMMRFEPNEKTDKTDLLSYYAVRYILFHNVRRVLVQYYYELNSLLVNIMTFIAKDEGTKNIDNYLRSLGIPLTKDFLGIDESLIQQKLNEINRNYTLSEKENIVEQKIQKRPFDPLMFFISPANQTYGRNVTLVRERRAAVEGFDLNNSLSIRAILFFNAITRTTRINENNITAWNHLAGAASAKHAAKLLTYMGSLGHQLNKQYEEVPNRYYNQLEDSYHDEMKEFLIDLALTLPIQILASNLTSIATAFRTMSKTLVKASLKTTFRSYLRQAFKSSFKRGVTLIRLNAKRTLVNTGKALRRELPRLNVQAERAELRATANSLNTSMPTKTIKFKHRFTGEAHSFGRRYGTQHSFIHKTLHNIKQSLGIRPSAAKTSRVFNADLTTQQYARLTKQLDEFERASKVSRTSKATVSQNAPLQSNIPANAARSSKQTVKIWQNVKNKVVTALTSFSLLVNPASYQKVFANTAKKETKKAVEQTVKQTAKKDVQNVGKKAIDTWIYEPINNNGILQEESRKLVKPKKQVGAGGGNPPWIKKSTSFDYNILEKGKNSKYLVGKDDLVSAARKKARFDKKWGINTNFTGTSNHPYSKVDKNFMKSLRKREVAPVGQITQREITTTSQEAINTAISTYERKGAIVYEKDLQEIIAKESKSGGLLEDVSIPEELNKDTWNDFYKNLKQEIASGNTKAKQFFDTHMANILKPDSMIVFEGKLNIPGVGKNVKTAMSVEKAIAARSNENILVLTDRGLGTVNAHSADLGGNIDKLMKGEVSAVFERKDGRLFVITEWDTKKRPICFVIEHDTKKGVNVIVTHYKLDKPQRIFNELRKNFKKTLYLDDDSAKILNSIKVKK